MIFKLSTEQILVSTKYQPVHIPTDLTKAINETDSFTNKIQVDHFDSDCSIVQGDHSDNNKDDGQTQCIDVNNSADDSYGELNSSQQLNGMETMGSSISTNVSANKHAGLTSTSIFLQGLFIQYLH